MIKISFKDGLVKEFDSPLSYCEILKAVDEKLLDKVVAVKIGENVKDLRDICSEDAELVLLTFDDIEGKRVFWHTSSHIMAQAILKFIPDAKLTIGPAIENGFYYDIDTEADINDEMFKKIEDEMVEIAKKNSPVERFVLSKEEALKMFPDNEYKRELINDLPEGEEISFYRQEGFTDLCAGPHLLSLGAVKAAKIMSVAGAYWRGDSKNKMLKRLYGITFPSQEGLDNYLNMLEEAKKRDHKKLGRELKLFMMHDAGPGFPFFLPKGMEVYNTLLAYWREIHRREKYVEIMTPIMLRRSLWDTSGHWNHYKDNMYFSIIDGEEYAIKPMNCPGGVLVYKSEPHSYRDLPIKAGEIGHVHRHELSGALNGLMRVRTFHQDDAHIFCTPEQAQDEVVKVAKLADEVYKKFGMSYHVELSTRPEDSMGTEEEWELATDGLRGALDRLGWDYIINEGDGAFYGPKIDFHLHDALGRTWQCGTIQWDMQMPQSFDMEYVGADGEKHRPIMLHRTIFGSIERFMGLLIEQFAGAFPTWLAPVQAAIIPVSEAHREYANEVAAKLEAAGIKVEVDDRNESLGYRIREQQGQKVPYMLVVGAKEMEAGTVSPRDRKEILKDAMKVEDFIAYVRKEIDERSL